MSLYNVDIRNKEKETKKRKTKMFQAIAKDFSGNALLTVLEYSMEEVRLSAYAEFHGWAECYTIEIVNPKTREVLDTIENKKPW